MKKITFLGLVLSSTLAFAQIEPAGGITPMAVPVDPGPGQGVHNSIKFDYDTAGNEIRRMIVYLSPGQGKQLTGEEIAEAENGLLETDASNGISYYPNPVRSELYIKWPQSTDKPVQDIYIIDMNGKTLDKISVIGSGENAVIDFVKYPMGIYNLQLYYSNGESKVLKIIKR